MSTSIAINVLWGVGDFGKHDIMFTGADVRLKLARLLRLQMAVGWFQVYIAFMAVDIARVTSLKLR